MEYAHGSHTGQSRASPNSASAPPSSGSQSLARQDHELGEIDSTDVAIEQPVVAARNVNVAVPPSSLGLDKLADALGSLVAVENEAGTGYHYLHLAGHA